MHRIENTKKNRINSAPKYSSNLSNENLQQGKDSDFWFHELCETGKWLYLYNDRRPEVYSKWQELLEIYA